jgi:hypothetical protein
MARAASVMESRCRPWPLRISDATKCASGVGFFMASFRYFSAFTKISARYISWLSRHLVHPKVFMPSIHRASSSTVSTGSHPASLSVSFVTVFSLGGVSTIPEASVRNHESARNTVGQTAHMLLVPRWMGCHRP